MQQQIAMNIFHDFVMQCLHCLRNCHDQITLLICRRWLAAEHFHIVLVITIRMYFWVNAMSGIYYGIGIEVQYKRLFCIPFLKSSIPFHSGIFHIPYRKFHSIVFHLPFHTMPCTRATFSYENRHFVVFSFSNQEKNKSDWERKRQKCRFS